MSGTCQICAKFFKRHTDIADHINEVHDSYSNDWAFNVNKMKRKKKDHLKATFAREAHEFNILKLRILHAERELARRFPGAPLPVHGLDTATFYEENEALVFTNGATKEQVAGRLVAMRHNTIIQGCDIYGNHPISYERVAASLEHFLANN